MFKQYKGIYGELKGYWIGYGGFKALIASPFLHLAILITALSYPLWFNQSWWDSVISTIPGLLGFTLGGYAIWLAIGDEKFKSLISGSTEERLSPFIRLNYAFLHFVLVQVTALIFALTLKGLSAWGDCWNDSVVIATGAFGYFLYIYAILCAFAAVLAILRYSRWYDTHIRNLKEK
ncbi:MAG: hypothetical protein AB7D03_03805 [Thiomicrospira sp.]